MGEKVQGIRSIIGRYKRKGDVKNSTGSGEAKELICTTHGYELRGGRVLEGRGVPGGGGQRGKIVIEYSLKNKISWCPIK